MKIFIYFSLSRYLKNNKLKTRGGKCFSTRLQTKRTKLLYEELTCSEMKSKLTLASHDSVWWTVVVILVVVHGSKSDGLGSLDRVRHDGQPAIDEQILTLEYFFIRSTEECNPSVKVIFFSNTFVYPNCLHDGLLLYLFTQLLSYPINRFTSSRLNEDNVWGQALINSVYVLAI